jgi:hypothetical protein
MSDQEYIAALNNTQGIVVKRIAQLEAENAKLRTILTDIVDDAAPEGSGTFQYRVDGGLIYDAYEILMGGEN